MLWKTIFCSNFIHILIIDKVQSNNCTLSVDASLQLIKFKQENPQPVGIMTTSNGAPVGWADAYLSMDRNVIQNEFLTESTINFVKETIPDRVVHASGAGAFGHFIVTHNFTQFCKAKLFEFVGKVTPVAARFSGVASLKGASETGFKEPQGFAVKFYTEEGNFDFVGLNTPVFAINNPLFFTSFIHSTKPNPVTNIFDETAFWDFIINRPEVLLQFFFVFTDRGNPDGHRHMRGHSIHTYQVVNERDESYFVRFRFRPVGGEKYLKTSETLRLAAVEPKYFTKDLYNAIARGDYPTWVLEAQILTQEDVKNCSVNPFEVNKNIPEEEFPYKPIGKLILNENPQNYFADIEQLAFCPCHLVPGILGAPDKLFEVRRLSYRLANIHRLGVNSGKIPVNCPYRSKTFTYNRDGSPPVNKNGGGIPNYYPNSFSGPIPTKDQPSLLNLRSGCTSNLDQVQNFYNNLNDYEKLTVVESINATLSKTPRFLQEKAITLLSKVDNDLGKKIAEVIGIK